MMLLRRVASCRSNLRGCIDGDFALGQLPADKIVVGVAASTTVGLRLLELLRESGAELRVQFAIARPMAQNYT